MNSLLEFWLPILLLFITATIAAIIARRKRDRCLKYFNHQPVLILLQNGKWLWGRFNVLPKVLELEFENPEKVDESDFKKASYVLYAPELDSICLILQPSPAAGTPEHEKWEKEICSIFNPSPMRRFCRSFWNACNALRDAISQALGMILGTLKTRTAMGMVSGVDQRAGEIGNALLEIVPLAYEPVLEKYLSKQVIVEQHNGGKVIEFYGLLQEYSGKYLLLRNVAYQPGPSIQIPLPERFDVIFPRNKALVRHCMVRNQAI